MLNIYIVHNGQFMEYPESENYSITYIDDRTQSGKKQSYKVKGHFAARKTPFIGVYNEDNKGVKGFYSEASINVFDDLNNYLHEQFTFE